MAASSPRAAGASRLRWRRAPSPRGRVPGRSSSGLGLSPAVGGCTEPAARSRPASRTPNKAEGTSAGPPGVRGRGLASAVGLPPSPAAGWEPGFVGPPVPRPGPRAGAGAGAFRCGRTCSPCASPGAVPRSTAWPTWSRVRLTSVPGRGGSVPPSKSTSRFGPGGGVGSSPILGPSLIPCPGLGGFAVRDSLGLPRPGCFPWLPWVVRRWGSRLCEAKARPLLWARPCQTIRGADRGSPPRFPLVLSPDVWGGA